MDNQMMTIHRAWRAALIATLLLTAGIAPAAEKVTYYHLDALGSPVAATDFLGNVVWRESYQPYGERIQDSPAAADNARWYTGHPQDPDTGLVYAGARYYDPGIGRFMAVDPVSFNEQDMQGFNKYEYGANNPYKFIDPNGERIVFAPGSTKEFVEATTAQLNTLKMTPTGKALVERLEKSQNDFVLREDATSHAYPDSEKNAADGSGTGGTVNHNPNWTPPVKTTSGSKQTPSDVVLGHELHHADDYDRGTLNRSVNPRTGIRRSEEAAVQTENKIRKELGHPERLGY